MTVSGKLVASGHRFAAVFTLNQTTGLIDPPAEDTPYYGATFYGSKAFAGNFPEPRKITHTGQDRVLQVDWLPPLESMSAELAVGPQDYDVMAALSGVKNTTLGTGKYISILTNKQGSEPSVGLWLYQQALDLDLGLRRWQSYMFAAAKCIFQPASQTDSTSDVVYKVAPAISKKKLWGTVLTEAIDGAVSAQMGQLMSEGLPLVVAWQAGGAAVDFSLTAGLEALNATTAWLVVTKNGVVVTPSAYTTGKITFALAPTAGDIIIAVYEAVAAP